MFVSFLTGGDDGIRTHDPLLAGQVLSQLSYTPIGIIQLTVQSLKIEQQFGFLSYALNFLVFCLNSTSIRHTRENVSVSP